MNGESRIGSCLLSARNLLLPSSLFLSLSLIRNKLEKCLTHFFGGTESIWFGLLFVFLLNFLTCCQNSLGSLAKFSNLTVSIFHFCLIDFNGLFVLSFFYYTGPEYQDFFGNFKTCLASCLNCLFSVFHISLYQGFECALYSLLVSFYVLVFYLRIHKFNKTSNHILKVTVILLISMSLKRVLVVTCNSWLFISILKRRELWLSHLLVFGGLSNFPFLLGV